MKRLKLLTCIATLLAAAVATAAPLPGGTLDPLSIPKYTDPVTIPPLMPGVAPNTFSIAARPRVQQVLPAGFPATRVFAYGSTNGAATFNWPAFTIEANQGAPTTVTWRNQLVDAKNNFVPHLLPIDPTLHWANPVGPADGRDTRPTFAVTPGPYKGPVPIVTHLHGAHVDPASDGFPEAWYLPNANNFSDCFQSDGPGCFWGRGTNYGNAPGFATAPGQATFVYRNDQKGATLWYHDHTLGMTRANVYAGLAGFYLLRDAYEKSLNLPGPYGKYEIPLAIQDRSFNVDGSLFYPDTRVFFDGFTGPYIPTPGSDISPIWNPEFFGNVMVVNGKTWPKLNVEPRKYRFRFLNGCDSRWLVLQLGTKALRPAGLKFNLIGTDGGFVSGPPVALDTIRLGPGERNDVVIDFSGLAPGARVVVMNLAADSPFGGAVTVQDAADKSTTGQVMAFDVVKLAAPDTSVLPATFAQTPDGFEPKAVTNKRVVTITEFDSIIDPNGPSEAQLGDAFGPLPWMDPSTENPAVRSTEEWTIVNRTADSHPIHLHQAQFRVVSRTPIDLVAYDNAIAACQATPSASGCPPDPSTFVKRGAATSPPFPWESGPKDTLQTNPGEMTRLVAYFDIPGLYVWHCHILSHEDNEMMRPLCVGGGCQQ
ncbi:MAG TPA: multicopper oxidase domain-containing protein [Chloroflexota bacterium]|nr:multicopper oxidase domain-containing protein [Chloroflexota bacterium]